MDWSGCGRNTMTPSKTAKSFGLDSLKQASRISNKSYKTLVNWFHSNRQLFDVVMLGCVAKIKAVDPDWE